MGQQAAEVPQPAEGEIALGGGAPDLGKTATDGVAIDRLSVDVDVSHEFSVLIEDFREVKLSGNPGFHQGSLILQALSD